jgi:hypothetical protein
MNLCKDCFADDDTGEGHAIGCPANYAWLDPYEDCDDLFCCGQFYEDGRCCYQPYKREEIEQKDGSI